MVKLCWLALSVKLLGVGFQEKSRLAVNGKFDYSRAFGSESVNAEVFQANIVYNDELLSVMVLICKSIISTYIQSTNHNDH